MKAVITGDIINSESTETEIWLKPLKALLSHWGSSPKDWEIYRGDEFQIKCEPQLAFKYVLAIKSLVKSIESLDVRMAIGIGEEKFTSEKITESNGSAYVASGRLLNQLKADGKTLAIQTPNLALNEELNLLFKWASIDFDSWTWAVAQILHEFIILPGITQEELAQKFSITQSSVSQRLKRANLDLISQTEQYYRLKISQL
ncbi:SatD family protein [Chryseobacterium sp. A301]